MKGIKTFLVGLCVGLTVLGMAASASAIPFNTSAVPFDIGDNYYVGLIDPGSPASEVAELGYVDYLIGLSPGSTILVTDTIAPYKSRNFDRSLSTLEELPDVIKDMDILFKPYKDIPVPPFVIDGPTYVLGKYSNVSLVWYVDVGSAKGNTFSLPLSLTNYGDLSHYTTMTRVPEPTSLLLLGFGLVGLAGARRMLRK